MSSRWPLGCNLTHVKRHVLRHAVLEAKRKTRLNLRQVDTSLDKLRRVCQVSSDPEAVWDRMQSKSAAPGRPCIRRAKPNQACESKGELDVLLWPAASLIHGSANCLSALFERRFHCHLDHFTKSNLQKAKGLRQAKRNSESTRPEDSGWLSAWFQDLSTCHSRDKWFFLLKPQTQEARTSEETDFLCNVRSVCNIEVIPEDMRICSTQILGQSGLA
jgi:hypothetical protein